MSETKLLTQDELKQILDYNPGTGDFTWRVPNSNRVGIGFKAGSAKKAGYIYIKISNKSYKAHRLAWLYFYGYWPKHEVDHWDGNSYNNCIENLREATHAQNGKNRKNNSDNKSGYRGVSWKSSQGKWVSQITFSGKVMHLGYFDNPSDASNAYEVAATKLFGKFKRIA